MLSSVERMFPVIIGVSSLGAKLVAGSVRCCARCHRSARAQVQAKAR